MAFLRLASVRSSFSSACLRSVTSRTIDWMKTSLPTSTRLRLISASKGVPSSRARRHSQNCGVPESARRPSCLNLSFDCAPSGWTGGQKSRGDFPIIHSRVQPSISRPLVLQSTNAPSLMRNMASFAFSKSILYFDSLSASASVMRFLDNAKANISPTILMRDRTFSDHLLADL